MSDLFDASHVYIKVVRRGSKNTRIELPDHTTQLVPNEELNSVWNLDPTKADGYVAPEPKPEKKPKKIKEKHPSNGLGVDHPFIQLAVSADKTTFQRDFMCPFGGDYDCE